jgi:hypothetical protein
MSMSNGSPFRGLVRPAELWDKWAFAALEVQLAFDAWKRAARELKMSAFLAYRAALDREEQAAAALAQAC